MDRPAYGRSCRVSTKKGQGKYIQAKWLGPRPVSEILIQPEGAGILSCGSCWRAAALSATGVQVQQLDPPPSYLHATVPLSHHLPSLPFAPHSNPNLLHLLRLGPPINPTATWTRDERRAQRPATSETASALRAPGPSATRPPASLLLQAERQNPLSGRHSTLHSAEREGMHGLHVEEGLCHGRGGH